MLTVFVKIEGVQVQTLLDTRSAVNTIRVPKCYKAVPLL